MQKVKSGVCKLWAKAYVGEVERRFERFVNFLSTDYVGEVLKKIDWDADTLSVEVCYAVHGAGKGSLAAKVYCEFDFAPDHLIDLQLASFGGTPGWVGIHGAGLHLVQNSLKSFCVDEYAETEKGVK